MASQITTCSQEFVVRFPADISRVKHCAKHICKQLTFSGRVIDELMMVTSELASNLLIHAREGKIVFSHIQGLPTGLMIESIDNGPGIGDIERAITDGFSTSQSLGYGLGTVNRLMDTLEVKSDNTKTLGTWICCCRYLPVSTHPPQRLPFEVGVASRPKPGMQVNGDGFIVQSFGKSLLVGVIDGLGHGQLAHEATEKIRQYVQAHHQLDLPLIFQGAHRAAQASRGGVMSLVRLEWAEERTQLYSGALGNIEARVYSEGMETLPVKRGILGGQLATPRFLRGEFGERQILVLFSDGVTSHWDASHRDLLATTPASLGARQLLWQLAKDHDDATVVIVKHSKSKREE